MNRADGPNHWCYVLLVFTPRPGTSVVVAGAGGFIGGHLSARLLGAGCRVRCVDIKPTSEWSQLHPEAENLVLDLRLAEDCSTAVEGVESVFDLAADMGGMGFIESHRVDCMRSVLISTHMLEAAHRAGAQRFFFSSSACVYNTDLQMDPKVTALKESDAFPALAERGYGWEKLFSEMLCQEYWAERGLRTFVARFHNVYGPMGTWRGGREKAPAAICRKVAEAAVTGSDTIEVWGDGTQTRSYTYIDDCVEGVLRLMSDDSLTATPINIGSSELVSVNELIDAVETLADLRLRRVYLPDAPKGVAGRNSDNTLIRQRLDWEPSTPLSVGIKVNYDWIHAQVKAEADSQ